MYLWRWQKVIIKTYYKIIRYLVFYLNDKNQFFYYALNFVEMELNECVRLV